MIFRGIPVNKKWGNGDMAYWVELLRFEPRFLTLNFCFVCFPGGSDSKESTCNVGDLDLIPRLGRYPGGGHDNTLQYSCLENPHGQRNLVGDSPWGRQELDTTEQLTLIIKIVLDQVWRKRTWSCICRDPGQWAQPSRGTEWGTEPSDMCSVASLGRVGASLEQVRLLATVGQLQD